jgi:hypothetical protein
VRGVRASWLEFALALAACASPPDDTLGMTLRDLPVLDHAKRR